VVRVSVLHADFYMWIISHTYSQEQKVDLNMSVYRKINEKWKTRKKKNYVGVVSKTAHIPGILGALVWIQKKMSL